MVFLCERWLGKFNSTNFNDLNMNMGELEDKSGNLILPSYFYLGIQEWDKNGFTGFTSDILGMAKAEGYVEKNSPQLRAMLFIQEYDSQARKNGATESTLVWKAITSHARLKFSDEGQIIASGIRMGREDIEERPIVETFIMRRLY